jgi:pimeloyl-ACP methyl ester carboxylesterase
MMAGMLASYLCIKAFSETDLTEDLKKFEVPTLILHGDDDQIVPIAASALLSAKLVRGAKLRAGLACLNNLAGFVKWISASVMPQPGLAAAD